MNNWLEWRDADLKAAHGMLKMKLYVHAGFQCHQVVEKALKAHCCRMSK
ncbi:MAG: HEPN domain-containing protein [Chitinispirillales bacterium]|nr:HEPN domain-containing protein [Chitinispirillales bacterium]